MRLVIPGIAVSPGVTHSDSRIVFVTGTVVKPQQPPISLLAQGTRRALEDGNHGLSCRLDSWFGSVCNAMWCDAVLHVWCGRVVWTYSLRVVWTCGVDVRVVLTCGVDVWYGRVVWTCGVGVWCGRVVWTCGVDVWYMGTCDVVDVW